MGNGRIKGVQQTFIKGLSSLKDRFRNRSVTTTNSKSSTKHIPGQSSINTTTSTPLQEREIKVDSKPLQKSSTSVTSISKPLSERQGQTFSLDDIGDFLAKFLSFFTPKPESLKYPRKVIIDVPEFGSFTLDSSILPPLPAGVELNSLLDIISLKVQDGAALYDQIIIEGSLSKDHIAEPEAISNLMWFLQVKAEAKSGSFTSGCISLQDEQLRLLQYLDSCPDVYQRISSHIPEFQSYKNDEKKQSGVHRGIDFVPEPYDPAKGDSALATHLEKVLPHQKQTLMIAPMFRDSGQIKDNRLLLKMEDHGAYQYKPKDGDSPYAPPSRSSQDHDFAHAAGHAWTFVQSTLRTVTGTQTTPNTKKERIPSSISKNYKNLIEEFKKRNLTEFSETLELNEPLSKSGGIRIMARNIEILMVLRTNPKLKKMGMHELPNDLEKLIKDLYYCITDPEKFDHTDVRIGDEVIFDTKELIL